MYYKFFKENEMEEAIKLRKQYKNSELLYLKENKKEFIAMILLLGYNRIFEDILQKPILVVIYEEVKENV